MGANITTLSTIGVSAAITLNPVAKATTLQLTVSGSSGAGTVDIQCTLDDPTTTPAPTIAWSIISSAPAIITSTISDLGGLVYTVLSPLGGVRLHSTAATGPGTGVTATLKSLQTVSG